MRNQESINVDSTQRNKKKDHLPEEPRPKTYVAVVLAQQQIVMQKAVVGRPHLGAAAPRVHPYHQLRQPPPATMSHLLVIPP